MTSVAGHPKNQLYIDSGASLHILFNKELMGGLQNLDRPLKIQAGGKPIHMPKIGSLHQVLRQLPLPISTYHYNEIDFANLLSFAKLADEYYIICNTKVDNAIYVQARMMVNTHNFKETISATYTTWILVKRTWTDIVILTL